MGDLIKESDINFCSGQNSYLQHKTSYCHKYFSLTMHVFRFALL